MRTPSSYAAEKRLLEEKATIAKAANDLAEREGSLSVEENTGFKKMLVDIFVIDDKVKDLRTLADSLDADEVRKADDTKRVKGTDPTRTPGDTKPAYIPKRHHEENDWQYELRCKRNTPQYAEACRNILQFGQGVIPTLPAELRGLFAQQDTAGGYLVIPEQIANKILKKVDNILWILKQATVMRVPRAMSQGIPTIENDPDSGDWTTEIQPITQDASMSFGKRLLVPTPVRKRLLVSERLLRMAFDATFWSADDQDGQGGDMLEIVWNRMAYKIAYTWEQAFYLGTGTGQPLGIYVASSQGVSTARDISTGATTDFTYDGLINTKMNLKAQYQARAKWDFSRTAIGKVLKLKDTQGRPLLNIVTIPGELPTLLGHPVQQSEFTPATFTTGLYVGMFFDPTNYGVAIAQDMTMAKADQLYMESGQIGIFAAAECDGQPMLEEAYSRMITA